MEGKFSGRTSWLGRNFSASALGVVCVCIKMLRDEGRLCEVVDATCCCFPETVGRWRPYDAVIAGILTDLWNPFACCTERMLAATCPPRAMRPKARGNIELFMFVLRECGWPFFGIVYKDNEALTMRKTGDSEGRVAMDEDDSVEMIET